MDQSFNRMTIDGDMSTNDSVLFLANGFSNVDIQHESSDVVSEFRKAVIRVCSCLARKCVTDGKRLPNL